MTNEARFSTICETLYLNLPAETIMVTITYLQYMFISMVMSYIKGADRCIFMHIHLCAGWYVLYTPQVYYTHLGNVLLQLTTGPLVEITTEEQSFRIR